MEAKIKTLHTNPLTVHCDDKQIHEETKYVYILVTKHHALTKPIQTIAAHIFSVTRWIY